jgi:hypothetical protein
MSEHRLIWNDALGLCRQDGPGHTAPVSQMEHVHNGVYSATRLGLLAQRGELETREALTTLRSFRAMQVKEPGNRQGCLRWYWEETEPVDTNAAFFIGMALMILYLAEGEKLDESVRAAIREIVADLAVWFGQELHIADPIYPNKYMGDLVCSWLAFEVLGREPTEELLRKSREWCDYWRREHWGWGEHMSAVYTMVLLNELSAVLLFCRAMPEAIRHDFRGLFENLMVINDAFGQGPRVPVIRSYAFAGSAESLPYRDFIRSKPHETELEGLSALSNLGGLYGAWYYRAGWLELAPPKREMSEWLEVPCRDKAVARAIIKPQIRIGAMSHYPIMEGVDHQTWGLSWQTFPAALWRPAGDWGFWRWATRSGDCERGHPAFSKASAYLGNALSTKVDPPPIPRMTSTLSPDGQLTMQRRLPVPSEADWDEVSDSFCLFDSHAQITANGVQLTLRWPDATVVVKWRGEGEPVWEPSAQGGNWVVRYDRAALAGATVLAHHWELTLSQTRLFPEKFQAGDPGDDQHDADQAHR